MEGCRDFEGTSYVLEHAIRTDFALVRAGKGYEVGLDLIVRSAQSSLKTSSLLGKERQNGAFMSVEGAQASFR